MSDLWMFMILNGVWASVTLILANKIQKYIERRDFWKREYYDIQKKYNDLKYKYSREDQPRIKGRFASYKDKK